MSGSVPGGGPKAEPNLTPILDMVFQLITFFMLVINFKAAELDLTLQLPVIGSAKPLPPDAKMKLLVLNVQIVTKCPKCDAMATLQRVLDDGDKGKVRGYNLVCERGHETPSKEGTIAKGEYALSVYKRLLTKQSRGDDHPSIARYIASEAEQSLKAAKMTLDDITKEGKELDDTVVIRADSICPCGAVGYAIAECQKQGYRRFALKTGMPTKK
jgi:biopolymer transport protein ExbD